MLSSNSYSTSILQREKNLHAWTSALSGGCNEHSDDILTVMTGGEGTEEDGQMKPGLLFF